jgi:hypothetical protein
MARAAFRITIFAFDASFSAVPEPRVGRMKPEMSPLLCQHRAFIVSSWILAYERMSCIRIRPTCFCWLVKVRNKQPGRSFLCCLPDNLR